MIVLLIRGINAARASLCLKPGHSRHIQPTFCTTTVFHVELTDSSAIANTVGRGVVKRQGVVTKPPPPRRSDEIIFTVVTVLFDSRTGT